MPCKRSKPTHLSKPTKSALSSLPIFRRYWLTMSKPMIRSMLSLLSLIGIILSFCSQGGLERAKDFSEHHADVKASEKMGRLSDFIKCYNEFDTQDDIHAINIVLTSLFFLLKILEFLIETVLARPYKQRHRWMAQTPMSCLKCLIDQQTAPSAQTSPAI